MTSAFTIVCATMALVHSVGQALPMRQQIGAATQGDISLLIRKPTQSHSRLIRPSAISRLAVRGRRRKREAITADETKNSVDDLHDLSEKELELLARIIQAQLDGDKSAKEPNVEYELLTADPIDLEQFDLYDRGSRLVSIPVPELIDEQSLPMKDIDQSQLLLLPDDDEQQQQPEQPEVAYEVIPLSDEMIDELELRARIARLIGALNERATRFF